MKPKLLKTEKLIEFLNSPFHTVCIDNWNEYLIRVYVYNNGIRDESKLFTLSKEVFKMIDACIFENKLNYTDLMIGLKSQIRKEYIDEILLDLK